MDTNEIGKSKTVIDKNVSPELSRLMQNIETSMVVDIVSKNRTITEQLMPEPDRKVNNIHYIPFMLGNIRFAVPLSDTLEVGKAMSVTPLPNLPLWIRGIRNIRGEVISVVDLKVFFGSSPCHSRTEEYIIVLNDGNMKTGIIVDGLMGVRSLERVESDMIDNPYPDGDISDYISGIIVDKDGVINVLDTQSLLGSERMNVF